MPSTHSPRHGSLQVWPRVRAKRQYPRVRSYVESKDAKPLAFAGYKAGMTRILAIDNRKSTPTKGNPIAIACTVIECPPLKVCGVAFYKDTVHGWTKVTQVLSDKLDKHLKKKITVPKKSSKKFDDVKPEEFDDLRLIIHTQPVLTGLAKDKPEIFEIPLGGKKDEKIAAAKEHMGKELAVSDVFAEGELVDSHSITKGKGFQGATKRNRTGLRSHKSEKGQRGPANIGAWTGARSWTVAFPGQVGYHQRTSYNKWILKVGNNPEEVIPKGDFVRYGKVKTTYMLVKGSVGGPKKRLITFTKAIRSNPKIPSQPPQITFISNKSQQ